MKIAFYRHKKALSSTFKAQSSKKIKIIAQKKL
jgi:hypothetical protein